MSKTHESSCVTKCRVGMKQRKQMLVDVRSQLYAAIKRLKFEGKENFIFFNMKFALLWIIGATQ